jgi:hypothetical protein
VTRAAPSAVTPEAIRSIPAGDLKAWRRRASGAQPVRVHLDVPLERCLAPPASAPAGTSPSSESYVNLSLNLGYHFNMVDAL